MSTLLRVGAAPAPFAAEAQYLDGACPRPEPVRLGIDETAQELVIARDDGIDLRWPLTAIREVPDQAGGDLFVLRLRDDPLQRLLLSDRDLAPRLPNLRRRAPVTKRRQLVLWAMAAVASVALIIGVLVPRLADQLAVFIPPEGERALGEVTLEQIRSALDQTGVAPVPLCEAPEGMAALSAMTDRLTDGQTMPLEITVSVLDHEMVNAFALPGGQVVLFRGLIDTAERPEEVAAVLAHELGHVVSRDPTRHALRSAGSIGVLGLLFGDFAGGAVVLFLAERLIDAQYTQAAEAGADAFAHDLLLAADVAPGALAEMFRRMRELGGEPEGLVAHFLSHPALGDRIEAAREATPEDFTPTPLLDDGGWSALQTICDD